MRHATSPLVAPSPSRSCARSLATTFSSWAVSSRRLAAPLPLTHPSIVTVYDVGEAGGLQYIVMEYVDGLSLKELVREVGRLSIDRAVAVASQVCAGLAFAHENGIIHRDVKPQNILISAPGGDTAGVGPGNEIRARLTDFGIARASGASSFTKENEVLGSVHYIAPEQVQGFETGPAADIYATGVVLYEMLTGEQPFTDDTAIGVAMKHIQQDPTPPRQLNAAIPEALEAVRPACPGQAPGGSIHNSVGDAICPAGHRACRTGADRSDRSRAPGRARTTATRDGWSPILGGAAAAAAGSFPGRLRAGRTLRGV